MKMTSLSVLAAAIAVSASMAFGAITTDQLISEYQTNGYSYISVKSGLTQIKVEAVKDGQRVETVYDIATGATLKTSTYTIGTIVSPDPGARVRSVNRDFSGSRRGSDDDGADGSDDDSSEGYDDNSSGSDDDAYDDNDDSSDDDANDDNDDSGHKSGRDRAKSKDRSDDSSDNNGKDDDSSDDDSNDDNDD